MKRKLKWLAIVLAVSLVGFGTAVLLWPRDRITAESWQKIQIGMTEDEVAEILGGAGRNFHEGVAEYRRLEKELGRPPFEMEVPELLEPENKLFKLDRAKSWIGRRGIIAIEFDQDNHVSLKRFDGGRWITAVFLIVCVIGLAGKGGAHETKTEMAGDCSRCLAAGIRHGIIVVATRPDHRRIVAEDPNWHDGGGSGGNTGWTRHDK
jgi:hypothetical protein